MNDETKTEDTVESLRLQIKKLNRLLSLQEKIITRAEMVMSTRDRIMDMLKAERLVQEKNLINIHEKNERQLTLLNAVVKATKIGLWDVGIVNNDLFHPENTFTWSNDFRKMLGYSDEIDFPNKLNSWKDRLHPDDKKKAVVDVAIHVADSTGTTPYDVEYRLLKKNGEYSYFRAYGEAIRDSDGCVMRLAGALMDITETKNTIINNELQLAKTNLMIKAAKIGLWDMEFLKDDLFHPENTFTWSKDFRKMLGYSDETDFPNVFNSWKDLLHPEDKERTLNAFANHLFDATGQTPYDIEYRLLKKNGEYSYYHAFGETIRNQDGKAIRVAGALMDITEAKNILFNTERLRQEAEVASKSKSNFLANMSHEMRTPMNAIIGMTAIGKKADNIEQKNHALNKIDDASSHLLGVINDVLDMAKIEANKLELAPIEYDFERMLQKVLTVVNFRIVEKHQKLTVNVDSNIPRFIIGDDQRLAQIITNLLSNAVKFTPEGGEIRLDATLVCETDGNCELRIEVTDSGIGISAEQKERLFLAFEQADAGISRQYGGTGLGLTISKRIVELMDGCIMVESESGKGAKFIFNVKVRRCIKESLGIDETDNDNVISAGEFGGKKLLIAEDVEINREIIIALLEDTGFEIDCAENGKEALEMIEAAPDKYDIVFMDVQMPVMNGHEATRRIRALPDHRNGKKLPIIAMTANVFKSDIEDCLAAGMDDHLGKPLDIDKVIEKLRMHLNQHELKR